MFSLEPCWIFVHVLGGLCVGYLLMCVRGTWIAFIVTTLWYAKYWPRKLWLCDHDFLVMHWVAFFGHNDLMCTEGTSRSTVLLWKFSCRLGYLYSTVVRCPCCCHAKSPSPYLHLSSPCILKRKKNVLLCLVLSLFRLFGQNHMWLNATL